jgi:hypothetical protein
MMRATILFGAAAVTLAAPAAAQQSVPGTVTINGAVADRCLFTRPAEVITLGELAQGSGGSSPGRLDKNKVNTRFATLTGWCNGAAARMTVQAKPLLNVDHLEDATGFDRRIDYTASATANRETAEDSSVGDLSTGAPAPVGLFTGDIVMTLSEASTPQEGLLIAGRYQGEVVVTLTPN